MSFLVIMWCASLVVMLGMLFYARTKERSRAPASTGSLESLGEFVFAELRALGGEFARGATRFRPYGERMLLVGGLLVKRGHNKVIEMAFGRVAVEKGKTSSFFLKRIVEHKDALNEKSRTEEF